MIFITVDEKETAGPQSLAIHNGNIKGRLEESSDEDESDDENGRAPIELLGEVTWLWVNKRALLMNSVGLYQ